LTTFLCFRVKLARIRGKGDAFYAIKIIKRHHVEKVGLDAFKQILKNEVQLLQKMDHPHILKLVEYNVEGELIVQANGNCTQIYFIVLELVEQGDLFSFIQTTTTFKGSKGGFSERFARYYFK
jgi:serine/threonine protein kinase